MNTSDRPKSSCENSILEVIITEEGVFTPQHGHDEDTTIDSSARLYLAEGLDESVTHLLATSPFPIPPVFLEMHARNGTSLSEVAEYPTGYLAVKWRAPVTQSRGQWTVEQRIESGRPYDVDTFRDPQDLRLNHTRYERCPAFPCRPYHPISISEEGENLLHATLECVSMCFGHVDGNLVVIVLFDPPRYHNVTEKKYEFWSDSDGLDETRTASVFVDHKRCRDRFLGKLQRWCSDGHLGGDVLSAVKEILLEMILEDERRVVSTINEGLDHIELSLSRDSTLSREVDTWRDRLGRWRNLLFHTKNSVRDLGSQFEVIPQCPDARAKKFGLWPCLPTRMRNLERDLHSTSLRLDSTFQVFMSTMSIVESARAIKEAETVTKLTHLAFFFVPLGLVTSAFGMNINEFQNQLTWGKWVITSVLIVVVTYAGLYLRQMSRFILDAPGLVSDMSFGRMSKLAITWLTIAKSTWRATPYLLVFLAWLGLNAAIITGLWKLIDSHLPLAAKTAISLAVLSGYLIAAITPPIMQYRKSRDSSSAGAIIGCLVMGLLMLAAMGFGIWKLLGSEIETGGKTVITFGILCYSTLLSLVPTVLTRGKQAQEATDVTPDYSSL